MCGHIDLILLVSHRAEEFVHVTAVIFNENASRVVGQNIDVKEHVKL